MKKKYLILSVFAIVFTACETDFDVNATWEEMTVVYGLLDAGDGQEVQQIKISKAFLGEMDALQMAQYADSINFDPNDLDVNVVRIRNNGITDTVSLVAVPTFRDGDLFYDTIMIYKFSTDSLPLKSDSEYELIIENKISGNVVTSRTEIISGFKFDMTNAYQFGFVSVFTEGVPSATVFSSSSIKWENSNDNGKIYQIDLLINYTEGPTGDPCPEIKQLVFSQDLVSDNDEILTIEGEDFFNFLSINLTKDDTKTRTFIDIDVVMTVGSEDLETYINVNKPITGIVQERPQFTNINNGIGLFSSRFTKIKNNLQLVSPASTDYLKSVDGLDRNFQ
jgi:hypothetical protein